MAYDEGLAERIRAVIGDDDVTERKMFVRALAAAEVVALVARLHG